MGNRVSHLVIGAVAATPLGAWAGQALAQSYTIQSISVTGSAGVLASAPSNVTVTLSPGGSFTPGYQEKPGSLTYKVTIKCANHGGKNCSASQTFLVSLKDTSSADTGRIAPLQAFTIGDNTVAVSGSPGAPVTYTLGGLTNGASTSFNVGFGIPLLSSGSTNTAVTRTFQVGAGASSITSTLDSTMVATVWSPLTITATANLNFGRIVRPSSGSGTVTLTTGGARSTTAGVLLPGSYGAAGFTVTGQNSEAVTVSVPASFTMTDSSSHYLTVTTTSTLSSPTQSLSSGTISFSVGGMLPIASNTADGAYTGNLQVTVQYN